MNLKNMGKNRKMAIKTIMPVIALVRKDFSFQARLHLILIFFMPSFDKYENTNVSDILIMPSYKSFYGSIFG
jgi:hypothetical protein